MHMLIERYVLTTTYEKLTLMLRTSQQKKRNFRTLWIQRINAGVAMYNMRYSSFVNGLDRANMRLNRKVLAEMAMTEPLSFKSVVEVVRST